MHENRENPVTTVIHVHLHIKPDPEVTARLDAIATQLGLTESTIMSAISDLKPTLDGIGADVSTIATGVTAVQEKLDALAASAGNPGTATVLTPADQQLLDDANTQATGLKNALDGVAAALANATASKTA